MKKINNKLTSGLIGMGLMAIIGSPFIVNAARGSTSTQNATSEISAQASSNAIVEESSAISEIASSAVESKIESSEPASNVVESKAVIENVEEVKSVTEETTSNASSESISQSAPSESPKTDSEVSVPVIPYNQTIPQVKTSDNSIKFESGSMKIHIQLSPGYVDTQNKKLVLGFDGGFDFKNGEDVKKYGFVVKDKNGSSIDFGGNEGLRILVPYKDIADISTLYFCLGDQQIIIVVKPATVQ